MNRKILIAVVVVVLIALAAWYFRGSSDNEVIEPPARDTLPAAPVPDLAPSPSPTGTRPSEAPAEQAEVVAPAPATLEESGDEASAAVSTLAPRLAEWLTPQEPVRKGVLLVDLVAEGRVPVKNRPFSYPAKTFAVDERDGELYLSPANYERATQLIDTITAIPPEQAVRYYGVWQPLLQKAHDELGRQESFDERLRRAIRQVLETKPLEGDIRLSRPNVFYTYADPELEGANEVSKLLWRLGPDNTRKLQEWLRQVNALL